MRWWLCTKPMRMLFKYTSFCFLQEIASRHRLLLATLLKMFLIDKMNYYLETFPLSFVLIRAIAQWFPGVVCAQSNCIPCHKDVRFLDRPTFSAQAFCLLDIAELFLRWYYHCTSARFLYYSRKAYFWTIIWRSSLDDMLSAHHQHC